MRKITAEDVRNVIREQNRDITDLAHEYGLSGTEESLVERLRRSQSERGARVAEQWMEINGIAIDSDVAQFAMGRALNIFRQMGELVATANNDDLKAMRLATSYLAAAWMGALSAGIMLGRRFPLDAEKEV